MSSANSAHFPYLPHTEQDRSLMLESLGLTSFEQLVEHIPQALRIKGLNLADGLSELDVSQAISQLAYKNLPASKQACFLGGGAYRRFVPAVVPAIVSRSEFATAYTPYQPEVSQGSLQIIYEFQSAICLLTGMDVANASMYDGPSASAEAALMACRLTKRNTIVIRETVNPDYAEVIKTYAKACELDVNSEFIPSHEIAALIVQYPDYFGCLEELSVLANEAHALGALFIVICDPINLAFLTPPSEQGADIVVGDLQSCGNYLSFGGPSGGYMACRNKFVRQLPGRIAGMTIDRHGQKAFTLTLQTREQHIRREKATSNICTNQALNALAMLVYLSALGPRGLQEIAQVSAQRAHYLQQKLCQIKGVKLLYDQPFLHEFVITTPFPAEDILSKLEEAAILGGVNLGRNNHALQKAILIAVTEMNSKIELDHYVLSLSSLLKQEEITSNNDRYHSNVIKPSKTSSTLP